MTPLALFLLGCAAVYLGTVESAFSLLMRLSLRLQVERDGLGPRLGRYLDDPAELFVPVRLLLGLVAMLVAVLLARALGTADLQHVALVVSLSAAGLVVCVHLIPLLIVRRDPDGVLEALLPSVDLVARAIRPVTLALTGLVEPRRERAPQGPEGEPAADSSAAAPEGAQADDALAPDDDRRLLQSIVEFGATLVREVMTPRPDIVSVPAGATLAELRGIMREQGYSRLPVFRDNLDNVLGFVFVKDLIQLPPDSDPASVVTTVMRPAYFVPETKPVSELLREFQRQQVQIAVVVDEYGGTAGVVTVEDLLEELVGEIRDEYDRETEPVTEEGEGVFAFAGKADVDEIGEHLGVVIEREGFDTVGGYVMSRVGRVPAVGERLDFDGLAIEVLDAERRRVNRVRIRRAPSGETAGDAT